MELRSNRSRSKTPFAAEKQHLYASEEDETEEEAVRTTTTTTVSNKTEVFETYTEGQILNNSSLSSTSKMVVKSKKSPRTKIKYKTSDYSSEDGENVVSSSKMLAQNEKNQFLEKALSSNGNSDVSALDLYRKAGRYWEVYPKTDWTYSRSSKDRVEIAPGVVAMPNMSRRSLHDHCSSSGEFYSTQHKHTNTESDDTQSNAYELHYRTRTYLSSGEDDGHYDYTDGTPKIKRFSRSSWQRSRIVGFFYAFYVTMAAVCSYFSRKQNAAVFWLLKKLHNFSCQVMLLDTWLLRTRRQSWSPRREEHDNKIPLLVVLCLIPLCLIGGWWALCYLKEALYAGTFARGTGEEVVRVTEKVFVESPSAGEVAASLSWEQLEAIAALIAEKGNHAEKERIVDANEIAEKIMNSREFRALLSEKHDVNGDAIAKALEEEVAKVKIDLEKARASEIAELLARLRLENAQNRAFFARNARRCCRDDLEGRVAAIFLDLLADDDGNEILRRLRALFTARDSLEARLQELGRDLKAEFANLLDSNRQVLLESVAERISSQWKERAFSFEGVDHEVGFIESVVERALRKYDADKIGLVDYAMESLGGQILSTRCTESYNSGTAVISVLGIPLWHPSNTPRTVITPGINPGECWAFQNFPGFLVVKLVAPVSVEAFTVEHISRSLVPGGKIDSAPRDFEVYGLSNETDRNPTRLGAYRFDYHGDPLQTFPAEVAGRVFEIIELRVLSNHGNPNFTCLYRFRVHGRQVEAGPT